MKAETLEYLLVLPMRDICMHNRLKHTLKTLEHESRNFDFVKTFCLYSRNLRFLVPLKRCRNYALCTV